MKKFIITILFIFLTAGSLTVYSQTTSSQKSNAKYTIADLKVFESQNHKYYGLKNDKDEIVVDAKYRKLIRLGQNAWIIQKKNYKFGLIDCEGNILIEPKYSHVERLFDKWVKLGNTHDFGIYDEKGHIIIPPEFKVIKPLFGHRFLTYKNYKYGIYNDKGEELLPNKYDFIYMPNSKTLRIKYKGLWYEAEQISKDTEFDMPDTTIKEVDGDTFKITQIVKNTGLGAGYGAVTAADYTLKFFSTISESYEETIDELMFSQGVETISIFMKLAWLPKFPVVYAKKYYENIFEPDNSPLSGIRSDIKEQMK